MTNFHGRLMNLPATGTGGYYEGHRDARHAAAEIGLEADALAARLAGAEKDAALDRELAQRNRDAVHELTERLEEAELDAARYRWMRDRWLVAGCAFPNIEDGYPLGPRVDAAIDAARATDSAQAAPPISHEPDCPWNNPEDRRCLCGARDSATPREGDDYEPSETLKAAAQEY